MMNIFVFWGALLLVDGVFGVDETLSVMEGDSVTLKPHTEIPEDDSAQWKFGEEIIARKKVTGLFSTSEGDVRFKGKLELDNQTGSLTITNITTDHTGDYKLQIRGRTETFKIFSVTVSGKVMPLSVKEGEPVFLHTGVTEIQGYDLIILKFGDHLIAEINKGKFMANNASADGIFKDRLLMPPNIVSFTIIGSRITDTGVYHLYMSSSTHTVQRNIPVTVGVFGVDETLSVMVGDSVTLNPDTEIPEETLWKFGEEIIATMNKADGLFSTSEGDVRFKGRLNLDNQTGSLTITNIRTKDTGLYKLQIRGRTETLKIFRVTVSDVVESVSVVEGDTVTLHTGVTGIQRDQIQWKFGRVLIADLKGPDGTTWSNLNNENGEITIRNIQSHQSGVYELEINTSSMILHRVLHITISGEMKTVSVKKGEPINLDTGLNKTHGYDQIILKFEDQSIAEINKGTSGFDDTSDKRFKGRLLMPANTVSLIIIGSRINDTGVYHLNMISSSYTVQRNISVTVDSGLSSGAVAGIVVGVLLVVFAAVAGVIYHRHKISKLQRSRDDAEENGTDVSLKDGQQ